MELPGQLIGKSSQAREILALRETLFGDMPLDQWPSSRMDPVAFPWDAFAMARSHLAAGRQDKAIQCWRNILSHQELEPRHILQAWHFLRLHGQSPPFGIAKKVLGAVVEVAMPDGLDLLAAYPDYTARYYNFSGAGIVWEHPDSSLDAAIDLLLAAARQVVDCIGPWDQLRPAPPTPDQVRISFLTPSGLHFGQGPFAALASDPVGGPVLRHATHLMQLLISKPTNANQQ